MVLGTLLADEIRFLTFRRISAAVAPDSAAPAQELVVPERPPLRHADGAARDPLRDHGRALHVRGRRPVGERVVSRRRGGVALTALNLEHAVFAIMSEGRNHDANPNLGAYMVVPSLVAVDPRVAALAHRLRFPRRRPGGALVLELRPGCECCDVDLPPEAANAFICTVECTFCASCAESKLRFKCPNCGGELVRRPRRPDDLLLKHPPSTKRVFKPGGC